MADGLSPDVRRDLHSDAVRLNRQHCWFGVLGLALAAVAVPISYLLRPYWFGRTLTAAGAMLVGVGQIFLERRRLRRMDPSQYE